MPGGGRGDAHRRLQVHSGWESRSGDRHRVSYLQVTARRDVEPARRWRLVDEDGVDGDERVADGELDRAARSVEPAGIVPASDGLGRDEVLEARPARGIRPDREPVAASLSCALDTLPHGAGGVTFEVVGPDGQDRRRGESVQDDRGRALVLRLIGDLELGRGDRGGVVRRSGRGDRRCGPRGADGEDHRHDRPDHDDPLSGPLPRSCRRPGGGSG